MTAVRFLYVGGGCFLAAAVLKYFGKNALAASLYVPGAIFGAIGILALIYLSWKQRHSP